MTTTEIRPLRSPGPKRALDGGLTPLQRALKGGVTTAEVGSSSHIFIRKTDGRLLVVCFKFAV
uniref:Uncharacterized protein n=1 Tax=viral metagenome TaxID=1070528 RepID=A0A6C0BQQ3_9ZZZZ